MLKGRFAPSPTGRMHLGNIYSALLSYLSVKSRGGEWHLRIEDIDPQRSRVAYAEQGMRDLEWLGLLWDGEVIWQSRRSDIYEAHLERLRAMGLTYPCFCTRADIMATQAPHESDGRIVYAGTCRPKTPLAMQQSVSEQTSNNPAVVSGYLDRKPATRLIVPDEDICFVDRHYGPQQVNLARHCGDYVVRRSDGAWAYQLAVVVDDALMEITEVVRGCDLLLSSAQQIYLYRLLGYDVPSFCHLPLLCNQAGQRLSKRDGSLDMAALRERYSPEQILGILAYAAGQTRTDEPIALSELVACFDWQKVPTHDILF